MRERRGEKLATKFTNDSHNRTDLCVRSSLRERVSLLARVSSPPSSSSSVELSTSPPSASSRRSLILLLGCFSLAHFDLVSRLVPQAYDFSGPSYWG